MGNSRFASFKSTIASLHRQARISVAVIACTGPEGPQGPAGPAGPAGPEGPEASNESATQPSFEVWAVDQSSTTSYGGGGLIYIWDGADISANASEATPEIIDLAKKMDEFLLWNPKDEKSALEGTPEDPRFAYVKRK